MLRTLTLGLNFKKYNKGQILLNYKKMLVNYLAELWGICLVAISLALLIKERHLKKLYASVESEDGLFLWGVVSLVIGVSMVLAYNVWEWQWQIIITLFGWASLLKGLTLLFLPDMVKSWTKKMETWPYLSYCLMASLLIGLTITYLGFTS